MYKKREKIHIVIREIKENAKKLRYALKPAEISRATWYLWEVANPRLKRLRVAAQRYCDDDRVEMVEDALFKNAMEGNLGAQCFFLKNKSNWKDAFEHKGEGFGDTKIILIRPEKKENEIKAKTISGRLPFQPE